jgi:hypothetical protein
VAVQGSARFDLAMQKVAGGCTPATLLMNMFLIPFDAAAAAALRI